MIGFGNLLSAELTKVRTLPATWIALAVAFTANTLLRALASTDVVHVADRSGPVPIAKLGTLMLAPVYVFMAVAVFAAGTEYRGGQIRVSLIAAPNRNRLFAAKLAVCAASSALAAIPVLLPGYLIQLVQHASATGDGKLGIGRAAAGLLAFVTAYLLLSAIGYGFAIIARSVVTPLAVLFLVPILVSPPLQSTFPYVVKFLPHEAALSFLGTPASHFIALSRMAGLLVLLAWDGLFLGSAWAVFLRRDS
jgi:ABC-2 type transport system permease protein